MTQVNLDKLKDGTVDLEDIKKQTGYNFDQIFHFSPLGLPEKEYRATVSFLFLRL